MHPDTVAMLKLTEQSYDNYNDILPKIKEILNEPERIDTFGFIQDFLYFWQNIVVVVVGLLGQLEHSNCVWVHHLSLFLSAHSVNDLLRTLRWFLGQEAAADRVGVFRNSAGRQDRELVGRQINHVVHVQPMSKEPV